MQLAAQQRLEKAIVPHTPNGGSVGGINSACSEGSSLHSLSMVVRAAPALICC
jgi:hypothetical protein